MSLLEHQHSGLESQPAVGASVAFRPEPLKVFTRGVGAHTNHRFGINRRTPNRAIEIGEVMEHVAQIETQFNAS